MVKRVIIVLMLLFIPLMLGVLFLLIGMNIGGNYFVNFEAFGVRGYEATGMIGFYFGILLGVLISTLLFIKVFYKKSQ